MEKDLIRVGLAQGRCDMQRREERGGTLWEDMAWHDKPQDCVQNSHNSGFIGGGVGTSYIQGSTRGHGKAW